MRREMKLKRGKFDSPESSAALAANTFGFFLNRPQDLPTLPNCGHLAWPVHSLSLEAEVRFPWHGGRHPVLDCLVVTPSTLIGIESKRFEPFRNWNRVSFSPAYWKPVWGDRMKRYEGSRGELNGTSFRKYLSARPYSIEVSGFFAEAMSFPPVISLHAITRCGVISWIGFLDIAIHFTYTDSTKSTYVEYIPNHGSVPTPLIRQFRRENGRVKRRILCNLSKLEPHLVEGIRLLLKGGTVFPDIHDAVSLRRSLPHGHVAAVAGAVRKLGFERLLQRKPGR